MDFEQLREPGLTYYGADAVRLLRYKAKPQVKCVPLHWHDRFEVLIIDEGAMLARIAGEEFVAKAGDIIIVNPGCTHEGMAIEELSYRVLMFEFVAQFAQDKTAYRLLRPFVNHVSVFMPLIHDAELMVVIDQIFDVTRGKRTGYQLMQVSLVYHFLSLLFERHQDTRYVRPVAEGRLRQVIEYIADHYCEDISSASISEMFGYDESYFCRLFKSVVGVRPMEYIRVLRLEKARRLLTNEKKGISKVALECGFSDVNYFTRCFRRHYGITAGEYRKKDGLASPVSVYINNLQ
jgi:AraC-like DNA-binding protein